MTSKHAARVGAAALLVAALGSAAIADGASFQRDVAAGQAALKAKHYDIAGRAFAAGLQLAPQQVGVVYALALSAAGRRDNAAALSWLRRYVAMDVHGPHDLDADFPSLRTLPEFAALKRRFAKSAAPLCNCRTAFTGAAKPFIAEGIALDGKRHRILVASVFARKIVVIANGRMTDFVASLPDGLSPFALVIDPAHDRLWVAAASVAQSHGATTAQRGRSALLSFDLDTASLRSDFRLPGQHVFNDIGLAPDGAVYLADALGPLYRLKYGAGALEVFGKPASLVSPQGIRIRRDNRYVLVADYALGLQRIDVLTGAILPLAVPPTVTTLGIDGLAPLADGSFVATQNGIGPMRVVRLRLSPDWSRVTALATIARATPELSDISLVASDGNDAVLVGVSQWASFSTNDVPEKPVPPWRLVRLMGL